MSPSSATSEAHQLISIGPAPRDNATEHPIMEKTTSEGQPTHAKGKWKFSGVFQDLRQRNKQKKKTTSEGGATHANWKWNFSGILQELRRRNKRKKLTRVPGTRQSILAILKTSWLNVLLIFIPLSWIFHFLNLNNVLVSVFSFLAIVPLDKLLAFATDELSLRLGQNLAGLLEVTLRNLVELTVAILALVNCELAVVQSALVGSILSNLLLVPGVCFFAGGTRFSEQGFGISVTQLNLSLLTLSVIGVLLPAAFNSTIRPAVGESDPLSTTQEGHDILAISHGVAINLLFIYFCYLIFQLFSHKNLYEVDYPNVQKSVAYSPELARRLHTTHDLEAAEKEEEEEIPQMSSKMAIVLIVVVTVIVTITVKFLVDSIDDLTLSGRISREFAGLILLPIVGNAADYAIIVPASVKDKLTRCLDVAVGSSIQIALFVIPFMITLGWILGKPLTLLFDPFESVVLFLSVLTVNYVVLDGKANWLKGMILICLYLNVAVTFWYYPGSDPAGLLASCPM